MYVEVTDLNRASVCVLVGILQPLVLDDYMRYVRSVVECQLCVFQVRSSDIVTPRYLDEDSDFNVWP